MDRSPANLVFETLDGLRLLVVYQSREPPSDAEWDAWLAASDELWNHHSEFRLLVLSEGGHPSREQIKRIEATKRRQEEVGGRQRSEPITAILSSSVAMRFVVSGVNLFNPRVRCYSFSARKAAYMHLGLSAAEEGLADMAIERLRARIEASAMKAEAPRAS